MSLPPVVVVGQGPAGLLAASLAISRGAACTVVAQGEGSLPLWGGAWSFRDWDAHGRPVADPWAFWRQRSDHPGADWTPGQWHAAWYRLMDIWRAAGIPVPANPPAQNRWTVTPSGRPTPLFLAPSGQYAATEPEAVWLAGWAELPDSFPHGIAETYRRVTGQPAQSVLLPPPPTWRETWGPLHWASFFDTAAGIEWLAQQLRQALPSSDRDAPLLLPQVIGLVHAPEQLTTLAQRLNRPVFEYPLPPPSPGGIRVRDRWRAWLAGRGVRFRRGTVVTLSEAGAGLADGRMLPGRVILATGGVLGGGLTVQWDGRVVNSATGTVAGQADDPVQLVACGIEPRETDGFAVAGRLLSGCDPDRHGDGGAVNLWSAHQAVTQVLGASVAS